MRKVLVSIIVPVYNVEKYIRKCVESIIDQDYENIEIILVDDGSPDNSGSIIRQISSKDKRIKVVQKKNGGVSSARNAGLELATGDYVMFVDGDDWVEPDYVSYFLDLVNRFECDIGMNKRNYGGENVRLEEKYNGKDYCVDDLTAIEWIYNDEIFVAVWNKIYSLRLLKEKEIRFCDSIWYGEGMLFNIECLQHISQVAIGEKSVYHQTENPESAMRHFKLENNYCGISSMYLQRAKWRKVNSKIEEEWKFHLLRFNKTIILGLGLSGIINDYPKAYRQCVSNIRRSIVFALKMEKNLKQKLIWLALFLSPKLLVYLMKMKHFYTES